MANPTTNYSFAMPTNTDLVKDLPADFEVFGQAVDTQMKTNADAAIPKTIVDAKGDIIAATAADTVSRIAVGANDTVLTADSSTATGLKWATPASGGMTLLTSGTLSGSAVNLTSISSSYRHLQLIIRNFKPVNDGARIYLRFNADTGAYYQTPGYASATNQSFGDTYMIASQVTDNTVAQGLCVYDVLDYTNTATWKTVRMFGVTNNDATSTNFQLWSVYGMYNQTGAISQINILLNSGNFTSGDYLLYGVK